jgi:flavin reductase (DIM6/NTAB) family NADH-FMN oxidoreductase RutF
VALVVLRPQRYTLEFLEAGDSFTLCAFPPEFKKALALLGSKSGRDGDKLKLTGLSPISSASVKAPGFEEADLIIECRKSYDGGAFDPKGFCDQALPAEVYPGKDYHKLFFGEILAIHGTEKYLAE